MTEEKRPIGRPTKYKPEYAELAYNYCLLGATDANLAEFFEVDESTINNWKVDFPEFFESIKKGKQIADATVAQSLFKRATGYEHPEDDIKVVSMGGNAGSEIVITPTTKRYPPDTGAAVFWLKNRQPKLWRDKQEIDHSSQDGSMTPKPVIDATQLSDESLAEIMALRNAKRK